MWDQTKQARFNTLRTAERQGTLTEADHVELQTLLQELDALETSYLHPATERVRQEREALEEQNRKLEDLLHEQQVYLADVRTVVAELAAREQRWRARYVEITGQEWTENKAKASG